MTIAVTPTQSDIQAALRSFLLGILPTGTAIVQGQDNRVPEPSEGDFVVMTAIRRRRIETNIDTSVDVVFTASIAGTLMTVTAIQAGAIAAGATLFGTGVAAGTTVIVQVSGTAGGAGTYTVSPTQVAPAQKMASGTTTLLQPTEITFQLDVHGPASPENAQIITTMFRDEYGVSTFATLNPNVAPLHADDPKQVPFNNDQNQIETRWIVEALLQANQSVVIPQQFADALDVTLIDVDASFPP